MSMSFSTASNSRWRPWEPGRAAGTGANGRLEAVKQAFVDAVADIGLAEARHLQLKARFSESIQDLWHLRPGVFELVAQCHTEAEAWQRLARLNTHFPTRSPRSGFGAFDALR